jgi:hypothetical protein
MHAEQIYLGEIHLLRILTDNPELHDAISVDDDRLVQYTGQDLEHLSPLKPY